MSGISAVACSHLLVVVVLVVLMVAVVPVSRAAAAGRRAPEPPTPTLTVVVHGEQARHHPGEELLLRIGANLAGVNGCPVVADLTMLAVTRNGHPLDGVEPATSRSVRGSAPGSLTIVAGPVAEAGRYRFAVILRPAGGCIASAARTEAIVDVRDTESLPASDDGVRAEQIDAFAVERQAVAELG
ncbi:hypothetical protein QSJ18_16430 [Gordonia sp. ABSL1-1]|uniref:hypothetical protein n=1 Tax=Gordonia sp. ABSL1-1 TaxID=3053923 RepID=UPI0025737A22|nr:hypothetical protein [Gordonia sp. ABSL1-1]MDL9938340.1 hypothetical protein [Gordonia sp. ABSL1-1]